MDLSVIIPAYNAQHTIARCVESVLSSSKYLLEIIIVDDGSTDDTLTLLCNLQQKYSNIVVLTQKNAGPSSARRLGLTRASGSYITFVDSDDYLETCAYDKLLDVLSSTNVDLLEFGYKRINVDGKATKIYHHTALSLKNSAIYEKFVKDENRINSLGNKIYKKELLKAVPQSASYSLAEYIERAGLIPQSWKRVGTMIIDSQQNRAHIFVRDTRRLAFDFYLDGNTNRHLKLDICMAMLQKVIRPMHEEIYNAYIYSTAAEDGSAPSYSTGTWYGDSHCGSSSRKCLSHISAPDIIKACTSCIAERTCVLVFDL